MAQLAPTPIRYIPAEPAEPMPHRGRDWRGYVALIREVTAAGYPPPPGYGELLARFGIEADLGAQPTAAKVNAHWPPPSSPVVATSRRCTVRLWLCA